MQDLKQSSSQKNHIKNPHNTGFDSDLLDMTPKAQGGKRKK